MYYVALEVYDISLVALFGSIVQASVNSSLVSV